jgi:hypothetical protein
VLRMALLRVLYGQAGAEEFVADDVTAGAMESESEVLVCRMSKVDGVDYVPYLAERGWVVAIPLESGRGTSARSCPGTVIRRSWPLVLGEGY